MSFLASSDASPSLPQWACDRLLPDSAFADAYHETLPHRRAIIKSTISRLHLLWGERRDALVAQSRTFDSSLQLVELRSRDDVVVIVVPEGFSSPARLLGAMLPAQLAGVETVCIAVKQDAPTEDMPQLAPGVLAAMELAGVELCFGASQEELRALPEELDCMGASSTIISLDATFVLHSAFALATVPRMDLWCWFETADDSLLDDIFWVYGEDMEVQCCGNAPEKSELPEMPLEVVQQFDKFLMIAPEEMLPEFLSNAYLAISPSVLGMWLWPGLAPDAFYTARRTLAE